MGWQLFRDEWERSLTVWRRLFGTRCQTGPKAPGPGELLAEGGCFDIHVGMGNQIKTYLPLDIRAEYFRA